MKRLFEGYFVFTILAVVAVWIVGQAEEGFFVRLIPRRKPRIHAPIEQPKAIQKDPTVRIPSQRSATIFEQEGNPRPDYPIEARQKKLEGDVLLTALVDAEGSTSKVRVLKTSGHWVLDMAAVEAEKQAKYWTTTTRQRIKKKYVFRLTDEASASSGLTSLE